MKLAHYLFKVTLSADRENSPEGASISASIIAEFIFLQKKTVAILLFFIRTSEFRRVKEK